MRKFQIGFIILLSAILLAACDQSNDPDVMQLMKEANEKNDVYYEIFVRSFADSDGDGIGDLNGITENLDYLDDLGVTALWLMPINEGPSYHGYSITDYYDIESDYGTMDDFQTLIDEAAKKDIKIMIDLVINHTSDQHPWYIDAQYDETSPYRDYYTWTGPSTAFSSFVGGMVDLNLASDAVVEEIHDMVDFYMAMGVTGFRLDAAKHFFDKAENNGTTVDNIVFIAELNAYMKAINEDSFLVSEVYEPSVDLYANYFQSSDSAFNFYASDKIVEAVSGSSISRLASRIQNSYEDFYTYNANFIDTSFLRNHDQDRFASVISQDYLDAKLKLGARILLTLPGSPIIYYGEEIGMKGIRYEALNVDGYDADIYDEYRRSPLLWGDTSIETTWLPDIGLNDETRDIATQQNDDESVWKAYQEIIEIRKEHPALMYGNTFELYKGNNNKIQGYIRHYTYEDSYSEAVLVIHNLSANAYEITDIEYEEIIMGSLNIAGYDTLILKINPDSIGDYM